MPTHVEDLACYRQQRSNRGQQFLAVIDPQSRIQPGLSILHLAEGMRYYGIESKYNLDHATNHYMCLWEITPEEIIGTWEWAELATNGQ